CAIVLLAQVGKQEFVMSCALGAFHAASRSRYKLRVALVEGCILQQKQHVRLNPEAKVADGEQDISRLVPSSRIDLFEASGEAEGLHLRWQFGQQQRMADADMVLVERCGNLIAEVGQ